MEQAERPSRVEERQDEQQAKGQPQVSGVELAPERARHAARHAPEHLRPRPDVGHLPSGVVDVDLYELLVRDDVADEPVAGRGVEVAKGAQRRVLAPHLRDGLRRLALRKDRLQVQPLARRRLRQRRRRGPSLVTCLRPGGKREQQREDYKRNDHILFPMKLTGVASTSETAWASTFGSSGPVTRISKIVTWIRNAPTLMAKKRAA